MAWVKPRVEQSTFLFYFVNFSLYKLCRVEQNSWTLKAGQSNLFSGQNKVIDKTNWMKDQLQHCVWCMSGNKLKNISRDLSHSWHNNLTPGAGSRDWVFLLWQGILFGHSQIVLWQLIHATSKTRQQDSESKMKIEV